MRSDCCSSEVSFSLWLKRTYYSFWDVVNRKKWLRPLYNLHYRILCWRGQDDFEDVPGLYDEDNPFNPEKFIEQCCRSRTDEQILLIAEFEAEVRRIRCIADNLCIKYYMLTHEKDAGLGRYCIYLHETAPDEDQMQRLALITGYNCAYCEADGKIIIDLDGRFEEYEKMEEDDQRDTLS